MSYDRILVPLDGSYLSEYILPHVEEMVRAFNADLILLHVITGREPDLSELTESQKKARADISQYLEQVSDTLARRNVQAQWRVCFGDPATEIVRHAAEYDADLVMMSTHGQGDGRQELLGSVAMAVVSSGHTPVMVVRPPDEVADR